MRISDSISFPSRFVEIEGSKMHYIEAGEGKPILFLHGIPTSSYLWRNVIPHLTSLGRCIAPDLIGFGQSDKPNIEYSIFDQIRYIEKFIETLNLKDIFLIMHGFGSIIGFDYAMRHEINCSGLVFYEAFLREENGNDISLPFQEQLMTLENEDEASELITNGASYVDKVLPQHVMRQLTEREMQHYRQPFLQKGAGKPLLQYLKELHEINDPHSKIGALIEKNSQKLTRSPLPKLLLYSIPGFITTISSVMWAKENLPNIEIVEIGEELHLGQESYPDLIGESISVWLQGVEQMHAA